MDAEIKVIKTQAQYDKVSLNFMELQRKYSLGLTNIIKTLLKGKSVKEQVMRFLAACVVSNTSRTKLGHSLA